MKISKSKRQLAQLLIEAGVKQFPGGAEWVAQDGDDATAYYYTEKPIRLPGRDYYGAEHYLRGCGRVDLHKTITNWHQTVLSRADFDQIVAEGAEQVEPQYCESVTLAIPEPVTAPTLDQLLQDYRNASDFAAAKQAEADEAAKMRDERWQAVQGRALDLHVRIIAGLAVDAEMRSPEPVITDWRDLRTGDVIQCVGNWEGELTHGLEFEVTELEPVTYCGNQPIRIEVPGASCPGTWGGEFRFISRP